MNETTDTRATLARALDHWRRCRTVDSRRAAALATRDAIEAATGLVYTAESLGEIVGYVRLRDGRRCWLELYCDDGELTASLVGTGMGPTDKSLPDLCCRTGAALVDALTAAGVPLPGLETGDDR